MLVFPEFGPLSTFRSESFRVPDGKRLWIEEVSLFVQLRETTDPPPVKAFAYLTTRQIELDENRAVFPQGAAWQHRLARQIAAAIRGNDPRNASDNHVNVH